jgi:hypothetical protein
MVIDWTISIGNIITMALAAIGAIGAFYALRTDIRILRHDLKNVQLRQDVLGETLNNVSATLTTVAVQDERITQLSKTVDEMRHGQGFVNPMRS